LLQEIRQINGKKRENVDDDQQGQESAQDAIPVWVHCSHFIIE